MKGDEEGLTESFFTLISEDMEKEWLPSVVLRANKDFSAVVPTTRDKCLTEGYSPSCRILMICSRHTPISLVYTRPCDILDAPVHRSDHSHMLWVHHFSAGHNYGTPHKNKTYFVVFFQATLHNTLIIKQLRLGNDGRVLGPQTG